MVMASDDNFQEASSKGDGYQGVKGIDGDGYLLHGENKHMDTQRNHVPVVNVVPGVLYNDIMEPVTPELLDQKLQSRSPSVGKHSFASESAQAYLPIMETVGDGLRTRGNIFDDSSQQARQISEANYSTFMNFGHSIRNTSNIGPDTHGAGKTLESKSRISVVSSNHMNKVDKELPGSPGHPSFGHETTSWNSDQWRSNYGSSRSSQFQHRDEIPSLSSKLSCDEIPSLSSRQHYNDEIPSLSRRRHYYDEIPSLSSRPHYYGEIPSLNSRRDYHDEIPSLSGRRRSGDEIPSQSSNWQYGDEIPSLSRRSHNSYEISSLSSQWNQSYSRGLSDRRIFGNEAGRHSSQWCRQGEIPMLPYQSKGRFHGNSSYRPRYLESVSGVNHHKNQSIGRDRLTKLTELTKPANSVDHSRFKQMSQKTRASRCTETLTEYPRGPRAYRVNSVASSPLIEKRNSSSLLVNKAQYNKSDFVIQYEQAKFFMIKSFSEDDIHKSIKYKVWASTRNGNSKLDAAFHEAQNIAMAKEGVCPVFLFFSVNTSGQFVGLAEMRGPVDYEKTMDFWQLSRWSGFFPLVWHIVKDIPNGHFQNITLENNNNAVVTYSKDTQEIGLPQGLKMLQIFKAYSEKSSILDDFDFYEELEKACLSRNVKTPLEENMYIEDLSSLEHLETGMEDLLL